MIDYIFLIIEPLGYTIVLYWVILLLEEIYKCLQPFPDIKKKYGQDCWAVITGATDGIGKAYCQELVKQNVNVCMIIRNKEKGEKLVQELSANSTSKFRIVIADFVRCTEVDFFDKINEQIKDLDIGVLINNVGVSMKNPFERQSEVDIRQMLTINIFPVLFLTKKVLPIMKSRKSRSAIINLSSIAGRLPLPYHQTYSATKAFDDHFSQSLAIETEGIDILSHRPFFVTTPLTNYEKEAGAITPEQCARGGLSRLGLEVTSHGYWYHRVMGFLLTYIIPQFIRTRQLKQVLIKRAKKNQ
ncbi:unnamed protein product (macronuclear) [Paramecium tetraurelia]|uniref:Steroid dehydrogenase n=1 Tax=Paramecium tetraurelia TaxID=5888 RepID=A0E5R3_PARTE|nr:uncharacterized protein GSPATT00003492001 [Paramecium tetraurelia]CAK90630.1 unnamed protein product [Paramecium tetraurelia]|eukprot:XP_001458027.1 hypothetical protein (macronuclear) [Paramecium tetraurelia strain d4-2]